MQETFGRTYKSGERGEAGVSSIVDNIRFNFLYIDNYVFGRTWIFEENVVPYSMLRYIVAGKGVFYIDGEKVEAVKNKIIYIPRGCSMSCESCSDNFSFTSIRFTTSVYFEGGDFLADYYSMPRSMDAQGEEKYFDIILSWVKGSNVARMYFVRGYLEILIGSLITRANSDKPVADTAEKDASLYTLEQIARRIRKSDRKIESRIQIVVDYISLHPTEKYTPSSMAEMAGLSKQRFSHLFKEQLGQSPMVYVREMRLNTAARKLLASDDSVSDVSYSVGYGDVNYFIREFKRAFGHTPNQYRKISRQ